MTIYQIQCLLAFLGYYTAGVDGIWGEGSVRACKAFQKDFGLDVDGVPGGRTQKALRHAVAFGIGSEDKPESPEDAFWASIPNFEPAEFDCMCGCGLNNVDHELVRICQRVRDHFDAAFIISSPCRCPEHNKAVGGVWNSQHQYGKAVDFRIKGRSAREVCAYVRQIPEIDYTYEIDGEHVHMELP